MDYSTINRAVLQTLPTYTLPPSYRLQDSMGNACYLDPPGYPSYFTQAIYTRYGNTPPYSRPQRVMHGSDDLFGDLFVVDGGQRKGDTRDAYRARVDAVLRSLWCPLPLDHLRTRLWIRTLYTHFAHCYADGTDTLVYPIPDYNRKVFVDNPAWSDDYRAAARAEVDAFNRQLDIHGAEIAVPDQHKAVRWIRQFYPEYEPDYALITSPPVAHTPDWWTTEARCPLPADCPGRCGMRRHPINGTWCQFCGWTAEAEVA